MLSSNTGSIQIHLDFDLGLIWNRSAESKKSCHPVTVAEVNTYSMGFLHESLTRKKRKEEMD